MIALRALGKSEIVTPTDRLTPSQEILFAAALYLFLERSKPVARVHLAEALWPGSADSARQHRLRQTIFQLKNLSIPLEANRETILIPQSARESDLDVLFVHGAGDIDLVESLHFLPGYTPDFSRAFSEWLDSKRTEVSAATSRLLINDIRRARSRGDWARVERLALKCMDVDPFNEEAVLARAEASAMRGAKHEAVSILDRYVADLGPGSGDIKLPASLMRRRISERVPEATLAERAEGIFVGRESDMHVLTGLMDDARAGNGRCCLLWGDAGIGKSRLAAELGRFGELQGVQVRRVACRRGDAQRPLSVFVEAVPQLLEMRGALGCSPDTIADLQRLTQFDVSSDAKRALELDPQSIFELIRLAIFDLIDAVSEEQCLMLVVEDVHWLDAASSRILGQLADWAARKRLLLVFTSRLRENPLLAACTRAGLLTHNVRPLSSEAATKMVMEMFDATNERHDDEFLEWCRTVGDGNPFFLHELVKQWLETKQRHVVPPSITTVIRERFSRLSAEGTQLLQACSVLGENSTLPRVEKMLQQEPYMLLAALNELSKTAMLSAERKPLNSAGDFRLAPKHDLISTVALGELNPHAEIFLNRRAAEVLETELGDDSQDTTLLWACAQHWQKAGDCARAYAMAIASAKHLLQVGLPQDAAAAFRSTRAFANTPDELRATAMFEIDALERAQAWTDLIRLVEEVRSIDGVSQDHDDLELKSLTAKWRLAINTTDLLDHALRCVSDTEASSGHRAQAGAFAMKIASNAGNWTAIDHIYASLRSIPRTDDIVTGTISEVEMIYHAVRGDVAMASQAAETYVASGASKATIDQAVRALSNAADVFILAGDTGRARDTLQKAIDLATFHRCLSLARWASVELVRTLMREGNVQQARVKLDEVGARSPDEEDQIAILRYDLLETQLLIEEGRLDAANTMIDRLLEQSHIYDRPRRGLIFATALRLLVRQSAERSRLHSLVTSLEKHHAEYSAAGWQDYEAYSLYMGLRELGEEQHGVDLLQEYKRVRRDTAKLPKEIEEVITSLG